MKVCLLSPLPPPAGGIATWTKLYLNNYISKKNDVHLINTAVIGKREKEDTRNLFSEIVRFLKIIKNLKRELKKCDVFHLNSSCSKLGFYRDYFCVKKIVKARKKVVVQFHCNIEDQIVSSSQKKILKKILKISNSVFVINKNSQKYLSDKYSFNSILVPNFINMKKESNNHIYNEFKNIVFVGNVTRAKGVDLIVETAREIKNLKFTIVGKICKDFSCDNLPNNIYLIGQVSNDDVIKYLEQADVFLFPTYTEGFPLSVLEAMHEGLPCITTRVGAIPDMLDDNGAIYVDLTKDSIIDAIQLLYDVKKRTQMGNFNFLKVKNSYNTDVVIKEIFQQYKIL